MVIKDGKAIEAVETTSMTADKGPQIAKEARVRESGGVFIRDRTTGKLVEVADVVTSVTRKP